LLMKRILTILVPLLICSSCTIAPSQEPDLLRQRLSANNIDIQYCNALFTETERSITAAHAIDSQDVRIAGHPYLRVNRFLATYRHEVFGKRFEAWLDQLQKIGLEGLSVEIQNLPINVRQRLHNEYIATGTTLIETLQQCANVIRSEALDEAGEQDLLRLKAFVPSEYKVWQRIAGLYPLTALVFRLGIKRWHEQTLATYRQPLPELKVAGKLIRYAPGQQAAPLSFSDVADIIKKSSVNPLNIPYPSAEQQKRLFDRFTPIFEIDTVSDDDRFGAPKWQEDDKPIVDTSKPAVYRHLSHSRAGKQVLLQLNYTVWFPARPLDSCIDLLAGQMDGITWRVTLSPDGKPWLFDTIHNCGCYHLFFPTRYAEKSVPESLYQEPVFTPQQQIPFNTDGRTVIRIAAGTHYIDRVYYVSASAEAGSHYQSIEADQLRSIPLAGGNRRSLFGQDGLVAGTERGERFLFWPMGIPSPGAMRQWGHHATAFVGRRHFDDPHLLANSFKFVQHD